MMWLTTIQDGNFSEENKTPTWASWDLMDNYLSDAFYDRKSTFSISTFVR
jgi:hypothetical protein